MAFFSALEDNTCKTQVNSMTFLRFIIYLLIWRGLFGRR